MTHPCRRRPASGTGFIGEGTILFGGSGFLGQHVLRKHPGIVSVGRTRPETPSRHVQVDDLGDLAMLREVPFHYVIFAVGNSDRETMEKPMHPIGESTPFDYHVVPLIRCLEQLKQHPIKKFIHCSTVLLYDANKVTLPVSEDAPVDPYLNKYVFSKHLAEQTCAFYSADIPIINLRLANMYGPTTRKRWDFISATTARLLEKGEATVRGTKSARDFIYVEDVADAIVRLLETRYTGTLNMGSGVMTSLKDVVSLLERVSGGRITDRDLPVEGPLKFRCDMTAMRYVIDWAPRFSIEEGVRRTFEVIKSVHG